MGFHVRNRNEPDVDDEVDIDGDDEAVFGDAQFTEGDVLAPSNDPRHAVDNQELEVEIEDDGDEIRLQNKTLRDLVAEGGVSMKEEGQGKGKAKEVVEDRETSRTDLAIAIARKRGNLPALVSALDRKIKELVWLSSRIFHGLKAIWKIRNLRRLPRFVEFALTRTRSQLYRPGVGTHVVENVGCAVWGQRNFVLFARGSQRRRN
jgi:E3 ubiquitin-protein ligase RNF220